MTVAVINSFVAKFIGDHLPEWLDVRWFDTPQQLLELAPIAEIGWFDHLDLQSTYKAARIATNVKWFNTLAAGVDPFPLDLFRERGVTLTNGAGLNAVPIAEYAVMGMLVVAKNYRAVVRSQDRHQWLTEAPGWTELASTSALIVGAGGIGGRIAELLRPWGVAVTEVRRTPAPGVLTSEQWRSRLGEFDWVILTVPSTPETDRMFGAAELAAMKPSACLLNFARGAVIDQEALIAALRDKTIAAAFLDVTDPEPLPPEHPLWSLDNCHISMHLSGRSQRTLYRRSAERFLANLERWHRGEPLESTVDLLRGY